MNEPMWHDARQLNILANVLSGCAMLALLASAAERFSQQPMFILQTVNIKGDTTHMSVPVARAALIGRLDQRRRNFFTVDLTRMRTAFETLPWVRQASVRRRWPNQLEVMLEEYRILGIWGTDQLLSVDGTVFTANPDEAESETGAVLPLFYGPMGSEKEMVARYRDFTHWLAPLGIPVQRVNLSARKAWTIWLANGLRIELGRSRNSDGKQDIDRLAIRSQHLVAAWKPVIQNRLEQIETVDLRYPNGLALRIKKQDKTK
jgi:cell division protein FtsQ